MACVKGGYIYRGVTQALIDGQMWLKNVFIAWVHV